MKFFIVIKSLLFSIGVVKCGNLDMSFPCSNDGMCKSLFPGNSVCRGSVCLCSDLSGNFKTCSVPQRSLKEPKNLGGVVGRFCKHDNECFAENTWCNTTNSQCQCKPQYVADSFNHRCLPIVHSIGGSCNDSKQCLINFHNTTCSDNQCVCVNGFHHINDKCWKSVGFGETCVVTQECLHVDYAECNDQKVCACSPSSTQSSNGKKCLPIARSISQECIESEQCRKAFHEADCIDRRCQCINSSHFVESIDKCITNKGLGAPCDQDYECYQEKLPDDIKNLICTDRVCTAAATTGKISSALIIILLFLVIKF